MKRFLLLAIPAAAIATLAACSMSSGTEDGAVGSAEQAAFTASGTPVAGQYAMEDYLVARELKKGAPPAGLCVAGTPDPWGDSASLDGGYPIAHTKWCKLRSDWATLKTQYSVLQWGVGTLVAGSGVVRTFSILPNKAVGPIFTTTTYDYTASVAATIQHNKFDALATTVCNMTKAATALSACTATPSGFLSTDTAYGGFSVKITFDPPGDGSTTGTVTVGSSSCFLAPKSGLNYIAPANTQGQLCQRADSTGLPLGTGTQCPYTTVQTTGYCN